MLKPVLTANWRYLAFLNFVVEPNLLEPRVPPGTELDFHNDETFVSIVGFLSSDVVLTGRPLPRERLFEEVDLRFYVRRRSVHEWRRGVVFVRKLVPKAAIPIVSPAFAGDPHLALSMRHNLVDRDSTVVAEYGWRRGSKWQSITMTASGEAQAVAGGSHEEFITERYWGYTVFPSRVSEYRIEHPRWRVWPAANWELATDMATLLGADFADALANEPISAFIAEGSDVRVFRRSDDIDPI